MKKILLTLAVIFGCLNAQAYDIFNNKDNHSYFGVRLSYELSAPSDVTVTNMPDNPKYEYFNPSSGFSAGVIYNMPLWKNLYFEPGLTLYYNTISYKQSLLDNFSSANDLESSSIRSFGLRIPILVGYHFDVLPSLQLSLFTGPELTLGFTAKQWDTYKDRSVITNAYDNTANRFDIKWRFGVGAQFLDHYYAAISGAAGMCDQAKGPQSMTVSLFDITLGYNF